MGFSFEEGPLLEDEWHNFDALNVPKDHPARDMQDTFFVKGEPGMVLRTHTSPVQIRYMESQMKKGVQPPYRVIVPGKVFRNEATDMTHEAEFFQIEGLAVGEDVTLANLKGTLARFFKELFKGAQVEIRFRPSFFPFTEPSVEVDMRITGENAPAKLRDKWIEMMGAGMVHPQVLKMRAWIRKSIRDLHSAWGSTASRFCAGASTTCATCTRPTYGSSINFSPLEIPYALYLRTPK